MTCTTQQFRTTDSRQTETGVRSSAARRGHRRKVEIFHMEVGQVPSGRAVLESPDLGHIDCEVDIQTFTGDRETRD